MTTIVRRQYDPISDLIGPLLTEREAEMLDYCQTLGEVYVGYVDGELVCCWGLIPPSFLSTQAYIWMWSSGKISHQFLFIRHSQLQVRKFLERYDTITGQCRINAYSAQRWLRWLGAEFNEPQGDLRPFVINRSA